MIGQSQEAFMSRGKQYFRPQRSLTPLSESRRERWQGIRRVVGWLLVAIATLVGGGLLLLLLSSCSTLDERDECCEEVRLVYRYVRTQNDEYQDFIQSQRHFLFDGRGFFLREVPSDPGVPWRVTLQRLEAGDYTMVTVGNATEGYTDLTTLRSGESSLSDLRLALYARVPGGQAFREAEELFWNSRAFHVEPKGRHRYICDMVNIHCHLEVKVMWQGLPPAGSSTYTLQLSYLTPGNTLMVNDAYTLHIAGEVPRERPLQSTPSFVMHQFPVVVSPPSAVVMREASLRGNELYTSAITLRYLDDRIPVLQLIHDGKELFNKPIDLHPLFMKWGWLPNQADEQIYPIELEILENGIVVVRPWVQTGVLDWADGGSFG